MRTNESQTRKTKFAGLDAVRALAALGVVLLHSCVPYLRHPMPGLAWPVRDTTSNVVDFGFWWIELFIMPLFLVIAGFFAWRTAEKRGSLALFKSRGKRLLLPLLFGVLVVLPLDLYCWVLGWVTEGLVAPIKLKSLKFDGVVDRDLWGLSHLWFLQYLFLYVVAVSVGRFAQQRFAFLQRLQPKLSTITLLILLIGTLVLYLRPEVVWGFQHAFVPIPSKWLYSGLFFALGAAIASHDGQLTWLKASWPRLVGPACMLSISAVVLGRWHLTGNGNQQLAEFSLAGLTCSSGLLVTCAVIGGSVARIDRVPRAIQYLAAASFWVYLVHHPILGLIHVDLKWMLPNAPPVIKAASAFLIASGLSLLTYEGLVRRTALGRLLGFSWEFPAVRAHADDDSSVDRLPFDRPSEADSPATERTIGKPRKAA